MPLSKIRPLLSAFIRALAQTIASGRRRLKRAHYMENALFL
jgi:hypothetical protein